MIRKIAKLSLPCVVVNYLFQGVIYLIAALKALGGAFGIGSVVQYVSSVTQFIAGVSGLVEQCNAWRANMPYLKNTLDFLDIPNKKYLGSLSVEQRDGNEYEIEFHNVSFRYPGSEDYALKNLNLKFKIGEAQKIALARALYKDAPFIVLDEPTAALDPVSEFEIYSKFNDIVEDKTAIYISHRLSSCRFFSDIAVFDKGELIQRGSHEELLLDENGKYFALWNAQA